MRLGGFVLATLCFLVPAARGEDVHQQLLDLGKRQEQERRQRFAAVKTKADLEALQKSLRDKFLHLLDGLPEAKGPPPVKIIGTIDAEDYVVHKLVYESLPGYFVPAVLYKPKKIDGRLPGIISPCGHSAVGKAAGTYQILHINLVKRGYIVLSYDPVGQGERSQFWDRDKGKSRFNLVCGEHAVLGNPLYLLGTNLARYRIWDGIRGLDYLASLPEVDGGRLGCVGNSGGGTLTAYIAALDPRVKAAAICCYITTLPRRMGNRIQADPDADPEQDIFGFVSEGIDHVGLLALRAPRPTMVGAAQFDFFPIEGARESYTEAKHLFEVAGAKDNLVRVEAAEKHGLSLPLRKGVYTWFDRWLADRKTQSEDEIAVKPRPAQDLFVCAQGQVNVDFQSRHLLTLALEEFDKKKKPSRQALDKLLRLDAAGVDFRLTEIVGPKSETVVLCINGNEAPAWEKELEFVKALKESGALVLFVDPRGVGALRPELAVRGHEYADPLVGVEENLAYNAFLTGKTLVGMRVADVRAAIAKVGGKRTRIVLCGRRDAALVALMTAAVEPAITHLAVEDMPLSMRDYFASEGRSVNAASILPGMLRDFGDVGDVLETIKSRKTLIAAGRGKLARSVASVASVAIVERGFAANPQVLIKWLGD